MKLLIASNNAHKVREIEEILSDYFDEMVTLREAGLVIDVVEDGKTFRENAVKKARETLEKSGFDAALADDSGLCVDALDGAPGVYSARFAGEECNDEKNNDKLLELMDGVPYEKRTAHFVSVVTLVYPDGEILSGTGECPGHLLTERRGNGGFGYDPLFLSDELNKTFAEIEMEEKNTVSHRARALAKLGELLKARQEKIDQE